MQVAKLAKGLWTWTGSVEGGADAVSLYVESGTSVVLVDPVLPPEDRERFLRALDKDVARLGGVVHIALTARGNRGRADELARRYDAPIWAPGDPDQPAPGVIALDLPDGAVAFWIVAHATLYSGDGRVRIISGTSP